jgi:hypothetical protein
MDKKSHGQMTGKVAETLCGYYEAKGYDVFYDHDSSKDNAGKIASWSGERYSRDAELGQLDVAIVPKGSDRALALIEIEATDDSPKALLGNLFGVLLGDHISFRGERQFSLGAHTTLILLGKSKVMHRKRNESLRAQGLQIKSSLSTGNAAIGNIVIDSFADERGLYTLLSSVLEQALKREG